MVLAFAPALLLLPLVASYTWPDQYDHLEDAFTITSGYGSMGVLDGVDPCSAAAPVRFLTTNGRQAASEWLRTAYHDMATHDVGTGLGGLDASIGFETDRPQNIGSAFNSSLVFFGAFQSKYSSMSDLIALGTIFAVKNCGGPSIPYRVGRIDATEAGPATVPEPQQDLDSHIASFARQGFNQSEMIGLVACGHTIGGVHELDFPQTVTGVITSTNTDGMVHFDSTFDSFDNKIATTWIDGTSVDALAVGFNETTNSDARIFSSDGNSTMRAFASDASFFAEQCGELLARMIDTVPNDVTLVDIRPVPVKPFQLQLSLDSTGMLNLGGFVRIFGTSAAATAASPSNMPVFLTWKDRSGASCSSCSAAAPYNPSFASGSLWGAVNLFQINATIDPRTSISSFVIDYAFDSSSPSTTADNGGSGFPVQDAILYDAAHSCINRTASTMTATAWIRNDSNDTLTSAYVSYTYPDSQPGTVVNLMKTIYANLTVSNSLSSPSPLYAFYSATFYSGPQIFSGVSFLDVIVEIGGKTLADRAKEAPGANCDPNLNF